MKLLLLMLGFYILSKLWCVSLFCLWKEEAEESLSL